MGIFKFAKKNKSISAEIRGNGASQNSELLSASKYSSMPRLFTINGITYDLDKPKDIARIPLFRSTFYINDTVYGMDTILYEHYRNCSNKKVRTAAFSKMCEFRNSGIINKSPKEIEFEQANAGKVASAEKNKNTLKLLDPNHRFLPIDEMDGPQFEEWCADLLRKVGYRDVTVNGKSGDQGVDILASKDGVKYAIQCKCYNSDLGNTPIQEVFAGKNFYNCHVGAVMTNRRFTIGGLQLANSTGVLLWDRDWIEKQAEICGIYQSKIPQNINFDYSYTDELFVSAVDAIMESHEASIETLTKELNIGFARAARIIDQMEENGILGPFQGSKPRNILISKSQWKAIKP